MDRNGQKMFEILSRRVSADFLPSAISRFNSAKSWLLNAVETHSISQDINSHSPSSRLGSSSGTMFGFLGFERGEKPISTLLDFLDKNINYFDSTTKNIRTVTRISVEIPTKKSFGLEFILPWSSTPWPLMIEEGISGLQFYINKPSLSSISGEGLQFERPIRGVDFNGEPYLTPLFAEFRKRLR